MHRPWLVLAILVAVASACGPKHTPTAPTESSPTTTGAIQDSPTTTTQNSHTSAATTDSSSPTSTKAAEPTTVTTPTPDTTTERVTTSTDAGTPEPPLECSRNGNIKGIFILVDGSGSFGTFWSKAKPFVDLFKNHVSRSIPLWLYQWSSVLEPTPYCSQIPGKKLPDASWSCYGTRDPCNGHSKNNTNCPTTQVVHLPAGWTEEEFENASLKVYEKYQRGWTQPWHYIDEVIETWKTEKQKLNVGENDRALVVSITDGQAGVPYDTTVAAFKEQNLKFVLVYMNSGDYPKDVLNYNTILEDPKDKITIAFNAAALNENLVKQILSKGCNSTVV